MIVFNAITGSDSDIRDNKKLNFYMNTGTIKISTIHSFKGWESEVVFLLLEKKNEGEKAFDELLYPAFNAFWLADKNKEALNPGRYW